MAILQTRVVRAVLAAVLLGWGGAAWAAEDGQIRLGSDYDIFGIGGDDYRPCERACNEDDRCKSWTFVKTIGQCRLKHSEAPAFPNPNAVSGISRKRGDRSRDEVVCAEFAVRVLDNNDANLANQCGFRGPQWTGEFGTAFGRCLEMRPDKRKEELEAMDVEIGECKKYASRAQERRCDHYARMAVAEAAANKQFKCGLEEGDQTWTSTSYDFHMRWCKSVPLTNLTAWTVNREARVLRCLAQAGEPDPDCERYAQISVRQFRDAQLLRCGGSFSGAFWNANERQHYEWCVKQPKSERARWVSERANAIEKCRRDRDKRRRIILKF
jgi:hypothetical protein